MMLFLIICIITKTIKSVRLIPKVIFFYVRKIENHLMDTVNRVVMVIGLLIAITLNGCNDSSTPCSEKDYPILSHELPFVESMNKMDSIYFKRDRFGKADTVLFTTENFIEDILIYYDCPIRMDKYERVSLRLVSDNDQEIVIELFNYSGSTTVFCTFVHGEILWTAAGVKDHSVELETGTFNNCVYKRDLFYKNLVPGFSERVFTGGGALDIKEDINDFSSTAYFNLDNGLININLYLDTDSFLTYQRIL